MREDDMMDIFLKWGIYFMILIAILIFLSTCGLQLGVQMSVDQSPNLITEGESDE